MNPWGSALERRSIQSGMRVRTQHGQRLGRVWLIGREVLYVRPWRFSRREFAVPLSRVARVSGRGVEVAGTLAELREPAGDRAARDILTHIHPLAEPTGAGHVHA